MYEVGLQFDAVYTSVLKRAILTSSRTRRNGAVVASYSKTWRLNERHYGDLVGKTRIR